jgi:nucleoside-diphosphate-sugar epimerase
MTLFTVLGSQGFIGSSLTAALVAAGHEVLTPPRDASLCDGEWGHVIDASGVTADFRTRPFDTVDAHVTHLNDLLRQGRFDSLVYLSSTRVYQRAAGPDAVVDEGAQLCVDVTDPGDLYNLSKLLGESLALHAGRRAKVVRLSNVYGRGDVSENFLTTVVRDAVVTGRVRFEQSPASAKDYVSLADVVALLPRIALTGRASLYNIASGVNTSHAQLAERLAALAECQVSFAPGAPTASFPRISNARLVDEFDFEFSSLLDDLPALVASGRARAEAAAC